MNFWVVVILVAIVAPIPVAILSELLDSRLGDALADRLASDEEASDREQRLEALEADVRYLSETVENLREETEFLRSLLEDRGEDGEERRLESGD